MRGNLKHGTVARLLVCAALVAHASHAQAQVQVEAPAGVFDCRADPSAGCAAPAVKPDATGGSFHFGAAVGQAFGFTVVQHIFRLREAKTRNELGGPFLEDWFTSVSHAGRNWSDGGKVFTNYIAHPMGGAVYAHIYRQNDSGRRDLAVGERGYGGMVMRAMLFSAITSVQFELGPVSEASIGNVGLHDPRKMGWVDFVITPTLGTAWMVGEDLIDERVLTRMDGHAMVLRNTVRFFLNPSRSGANLARGKWPWYRARDLRDGRRTPSR